MTSKLSFAGERELRWIELGECLVTYVEADVELPDSLWDAWMEALRRPDATRLMLCSWGPTQPSHQQWRRATRLMRERGIPVAVVTQARHNLALAKAASWLGTNMQSYRWPQLADACEFLGIDKTDKVAARAKVIALRDRFGQVTGNPETGELGQGRGYASRGYAHSAPLSASSELVLETSSEIQAKLAEIQARIHARQQPPRS